MILLVVSDGNDSTKGWKSLFENPGVIEIRELHEVFVHSENHSLVHQIVQHSSDPWQWEEKSSLLFWRKKNRDFETKGVDLSPPRDATTGMGRERELREHDGSHKRSRNYSRELRERTPLRHILRAR